MFITVVHGLTPSPSMVSRDSLKLPLVPWPDSTLVTLETHCSPPSGAGEHVQYGFK